MSYYIRLLVVGKKVFLQLMANLSRSYVTQGEKPKTISVIVGTNRVKPDSHSAVLSDPEGRGSHGPPDFGRSVNPISTGGGGVDYAHHITICLPPRIFRPSYAYDPAMYRHMTAKKSIQKDTSGEKQHLLPQGLLDSIRFGLNLFKANFLFHT